TFSFSPASINMIVFLSRQEAHIFTFIIHQHHWPLSTFFVGRRHTVEEEKVRRFFCSAHLLLKKKYIKMETPDPHREYAFEGGDPEESEEESEEEPERHAPTFENPTAACRYLIDLSQKLRLEESDLSPE